MNQIDFIKSIAKEERYSLRSLNEKLNEIDESRNKTYESFFRTLKRGNLKSSELQQIANLLGYEIKWIKKE